MPSVPREKYPEMNWRAADKVAAWKIFKRRMNVIFMADQIPEERQWALILVAGGDEAYNRWDTLEETVKDRKQVDQVWDAFEKSFEQSTSFWHFRDTYLADFRQDESETTVDLDLRIKQTVRGCQWKKETEEERMIDLLYHATIYYEIRKFVQESEPATLTYEMVIEKAKAPFLYRAKTSFWSLRDCLINLFSIEGYPDEIISDNRPPFQSKEFAKFLSGLGIKHTTSSPGYPHSNGFIERHIQTVKNMLSKSSNTQSFQEVLADLRTTRIGTGLPSPAEILHGRNLTTRVQAEIDIKAICSVLQERQLKMMLDHDSSRRAKKARPLVVGERCHVLGPGNKWIDAFITGITDSGRSYETQVEATGKQLMRNRSHIRPRSPDIPHMHASFLQHNAVPSATSDGNAPSERQNSVISGCQQLANGQEMVLSGNRKGSIKQTNTSQVLVSETVPDRRVQLSRWAKMTRFGNNPVTSTVSIPPRRQPGRDTSTRNRR